MKAFLHEIVKRDDGSMQLSVSFGQGATKSYVVEVDTDGGVFRGASTEWDIFTALSDASLKRFGNSCVYHMQLLGILKALHEGAKLTRLPVDIGATNYWPHRPGLLRVIWNKFKIVLMRVGVYRPRAWVHTDYRRGV